MKKYLLISAFCVCAALSAMAGEQRVERTDGLVVAQTSQPQGQINSLADEMGNYSDDMSSHESCKITYSGMASHYNITVAGISGPVYTTLGTGGRVPRPIRPPKPGDEPDPGETIESTIRDILTNGGGNHSFFAKHHGFDGPEIVTLGTGGKVPKPIKPRTSNPGDQLTPMTYGGGNPLTFVSTSHGSKPAGDINSDGVLNLEDVTAMVDSLLSARNNGEGNGIGDVTGVIDQLLGE